MSGHQHGTIEDTMYLYFSSNDTSGSGGDGATPLYDVRLAGASASAAPVLSGTPDLLSHANYPAGCHEVAVAATTGNGFTVDATYGVFCTIAVDSQNPSGFVGSFTLTPYATASSVDGIGTAGGAAINIDANDDNYDGGITGVTSATTKVGTQTNTYTSTSILDGTSHVMTHATNAIDIVYQFLTGGGTEPVAVVWTGYLTSANDSCNIRAWDHVGAAWEIIGTITGTGGTTNQVFNPVLYTRHRGTSAAELGKVYIRIDCTGQTSPVLNTDQIYIQYSITSRSVGYAQGRVWIDTADGTAGTEDYVNGTADNKVLTFADALTIGTSVGLHEYNMSTDSTLTLAATLNDAIVWGVGYALNFGGQDCGNTHFYHASPVNGIVTAASGHTDLIDSIVADMTCDEFHFTNCTLTGTVTLGSTAGDIRIVNCRSGIAGATTPILDFGTGSANHDVFFADWQNGIEIKNFNVTTTGGTDLLSMSGIGKLIVASTCDGGTINLRGIWEIEDNSGGAVTFNYDDLHTEIELIHTATITDIPATLGTPSVDLATDIANVLLEALTESYAADGATGTAAQLLYAIQQFLHESNRAGVTNTVKGLDGTTTKQTFTYDDANNPTAITRAT